MKDIPAADLLATWAFRELLAARRGANPYPLTGATVRWELLKDAALILPVSKRAPRRRPPLTKQETFCKILDLEKTLARAEKQAQEILARGSDSEMTMLAMTLGRFVGSAQSQILDTVERGPGSAKAVETLAFFALKAANELHELARKRRDLVKPVAEKWFGWPVIFDPHPDALKELVDEMTALGVATKSPERRRAKWSNRPAKDQPNRAAVGKYANRIGHVLKTIHGDGNLASALHDNPAGWPDWIVSTVKLPPLRKDTAPQWFDVGWQMLTVAAGGDVTTLQELAPVGESNRRYAKRLATTAKGKSSPQTSRQASDIRKTLRKAFLARFGN